MFFEDICSISEVKGLVQFLGWLILAANLVINIFVMSDGRIAQVEVILFKIINGKPLFLLLKRQLQRGGFWQPVTGGVEQGEDLKETALREVFEETGIKDYVRILEDLYYFEFEANGGHGWTKEYVFGLQVDETTESIMSDEHSEQKWCELDEALELLKYENNRVGFRKIAQMLVSA